MTSAALSPAYAAARQHAALLPRDRGLILVSGADRASYLQGLLTNDIAALRAGQGCYAAYLTAQGRMITDLYVYELGDVILLAVPRALKDSVLAKLDQFIFSEDVQLGDVSDTSAALALIGPEAADVAQQVTGIDAAELQLLPEHGNMRRMVNGQPVVVLRVSDTGELGLEFVVARDRAEHLARAFEASGAVPADPATADLLRIESGVPLFGRDMDEETIPLEAGIENRAISFTKGCYVGQEVIIRVLHRGHGRVARKLVGLVFDPEQDVPQPGVALYAADKEIGTLTSSAVSAALGRPIALGYVKRDFTPPGTRVLTADGAQADVVALPFERP
jgi:folate-binding protein YgfZ